MNKIICVDFDGVLHSYTSGWKGADVIPDPPVPGAIEWLANFVEGGDGLWYTIAIYSSRSNHKGGIKAMKDWLRYCHAEKFPNENTEHFIIQIKFPTEKPPAHITIDDRAICFRGTFPSKIELDAFKPWNR